jgi:hypothetical protein
MSKGDVAAIVGFDILNILEDIMSDDRRGRTIPDKPVSDTATTPEFKGISNIPIKGGLQNQEPHYDYLIEKKNSLIPYSAIFSVMYGSCLDLISCGEDRTIRRLVLNVGDVVLFDGYNLHRGCNYDQFNLRIFGYYPTVQNKVKDEVHYLA